MDSEPVITSCRNPLVRRLRALSSKEGRDQEGLILLEGTHLLEEALNNNFIPEQIIATKCWLYRHSYLLELFHHKLIIKKVNEEVLAAALTTKTPDGVASIFSINFLPKIVSKPNFVLALDRLQDPGNMGNLFRTALAADVEMLWLALGADPLTQKVMRASAGAVLKMPYMRIGSTEEEAVTLLARKLEDSSKEGFQVLATVLPNAEFEKDFSPYWEIDWAKPTVLVLGNEGKGIHPVIKESCNSLVTLPHSKAVESLNVASVAVPMLLERRRAKMIGDT